MLETSQHGGTYGALGATLEICLIDLLLSGDNAVVIALACRGLPAQLWRRAVWLGTAAAVVLRIALTALAALVLKVPYLQLIGAVALVAIAIKLMTDEPASAAGAGASQQDHDMWKALTTIVVADTVMSMDNVLAVAAAAHGSFWLLTFGLLLSVPILIFGSATVAGMLERYPVLIPAGGALLGWVAGETAVSDPAIKEWIDTQSFGLGALAPLIGAAYVLVQSRLAQAARAPGVAATLRRVAAPAAAPAPVKAVPAGVRAPPAPPPRPHPVSSAPQAPSAPLDAAQQGPPMSNRRTDLIITAAILVPLFALIVAVYFMAWSIRHH
jgi:YjbE family integral membrane protein